MIVCRIMLFITILHYIITCHVISILRQRGDSRRGEPADAILSYVVLCYSTF